MIANTLLSFEVEISFYCLTTTNKDGSSKVEHQNALIIYEKYRQK
jgi:hypothetical protein